MQSWAYLTSLWLMQKAVPHACVLSLTVLKLLLTVLKLLFWMTIQVLNSTHKPLLRSLDDALPAYIGNSRAALYANSFPWIPTYPGIHTWVNCIPCCIRLLMAQNMLLTGVFGVLLWGAYVLLITILKELQLLSETIDSQSMQYRL